MKHVIAIAPGEPAFNGFLGLPATLGGGSEFHWKQKQAQEARELSPVNPFFRHGDAQAFLCIEGTRVLGRIVASLDASRVDDVGQFGYFESLDDPSVAQLLLDAADSWLSIRGRSEVDGPVDLNIWTRYRLQLSGFDRAPYLGEPRSRTYYPDLLRRSGFAEHLRWSTYAFTPEELRFLLDYFSQRHAQRSSAEASCLKIAHLDGRDFDAGLSRLRTAIMAAWQGNYGFSLIDEPEFARLFQGLRRIDSPRMGFWFQDGTVPCAFGLAHPDDSSALGKRTVIKAYGIAPPHRKTSLVYRILRDLFAVALERGAPTLLSLAVQTNDLYGRYKEPERTYGIFRKTITGARSSS